MFFISLPLEGKIDEFSPHPEKAIVVINHWFSGLTMVNFNFKKSN